MKITLTKKESEKFFHDGLCNGLTDAYYSDLELDFNGHDYNKAKKTLQTKLKAGQIPHEMTVEKGETPSICHENVLMEILRNGGKLKMVDKDGGKYTRTIELKDVWNRVQKTDPHWLLEMEEEKGDSTTAFEVLQMVFFEKSVFG